MRTNIPEKLLKIVDEIDERGHANQTKLTVLKKWLDRPQRLSAFAIWIATRAASSKGKTERAAAKLLREARTLLAVVDQLHPLLDRQAAEALHDRLRDFQNEYQRQQWGSARIIHNWNLLLVEQGLAIHLWYLDSPPLGYKLAADYCRHYDSRYGTDLNGPSRAKIEEIVQFMCAIEASEDNSK
ncbi:MAG: hypothetical protein EXS18_04810 [Verrucomicrobiae bacterium]|nr:hypothetical protein [Verrucomicrobiae bacterium]